MDGLTSQNVMPVDGKGLLLGTHSDNEEEDPNDCVGTYRGIRAAR